MSIFEKQAWDELLLSIPASEMGIKEHSEFWAPE